ncbi:MAG: hypothetical protein ABFR65_06580 [Pseudomonadota bacterium]
MTYKFIISGAVVPASDGRQALLLEPGERDLVLAEMRSFLESVQTITAAVGREDMTRIAVAARKVGAAAQNEVPGSLVGKLPLAFKRLGFDTHKQFDMLALDAEELGDPGHALQQLSVLMQNCVACHAAYRIDAVRPGS